MDVVERAGLPAVGIFGEGFKAMAEQLARLAGLPALRLAVYPGMMATSAIEQLVAVSRSDLTPQIIRGLLSDPQTISSGVESDKSRESLTIIYRGDLDEIEELFHKNGWSDGLPIIPPTIERVEQFLAHSALPKHEVLGLLAPEKCEATVLNVAVNGVMSGCRPEYMPILLAIVQCLVEPAFRIEDAGSTPGWEPLVVISGALVREFDFNSGTGAMRVGRRANTSIGRFTRLYMRNVAGLRIPPGVTDQAGFGTTFNVVMAENEEAIHQLGWEPYRVDRGFNLDDTVVTVQSVLNISAPIYSYRDNPTDHLQIIAEQLERSWSMAQSAFKRRAGYILLAISPSIAQVFADHDITKRDIRKYLVEHMHTTAKVFDGSRGRKPFDLQELVDEGRLSAEAIQSDDPDRKIPIMLSEDWIGVLVAGNPGRNQSRGYGTNHAQGLPISRRVVLANKEP